MKNPNEHVGFQMAKDYMNDRWQYKESRHMVKQAQIKHPSRFYRVVCGTLVTTGHIWLPWDAV